MSHMFNGAIIFNQPLNWDVSNVTNMAFMFYYAGSFTGPLIWTNPETGETGPWNVSNVTNMSHMFAGATSFNQPLNWDVSNVTDMQGMFNEAINFNQLLFWDIPRGTHIGYMYENTKIIKQMEKLSTKKPAYAWIDALQHLGVRNDLDFQTTKDILQYIGDPDVEKDYTDGNGNTYYMPRGGRKRRTKRRKSGKRKTRSHRK